MNLGDAAKTEPGRYDLDSMDFWGMGLGRGWGEYVDAIEVAGVKDYGEFCERTDGTNEVPDFWSVYVHSRDWGCECVGDYATPENALADAEEIRIAYAPHLTPVDIEDLT